MKRKGETNHFHLAGRLFQEYVCINQAKAEQQRYNFIEMNQEKLRSDLYQNVVDQLQGGDVDKNELGKQIILPATHPGSPRDMHARFQDAMAICSKFGGGKIDFFITMTANPNWKEIQENLDGQKSENRSDIIARVFQLKLKALEEELYKKGIFGKSVAHLRVIEFQKRGLPHAHILVILHMDDRIRIGDDADKVVCAEIPPHPDSITDQNPTKQQEKRAQVKNSESTY